MFKTKGAMLGIVAAVVAGSLMVAGLGVSTTSGAPTDLYVPSDGIGDGLGNWNLPTDPGAQPGNPPASPVEPPANNPIGQNPATNPSGSTGAGGSAPGALPDAGFGATADGNGIGNLMVLVGLAGMALVGAGASVAATKRD
jgi:hypothetical protein